MPRMLRSKWFWSFSFLLLPFKAFAYPENIRFGYNNCQTCHISPTGGGIVNKYGKGASEAFMNTWAYGGQAEPTYGIFHLPNQLDIGGDIRQVEYNAQSADYEIHRKFLMQTDFEVSLEVMPGFRFVTSGGQYGEQKRWERRRYYALFENQKETYSTYIRAGRFFPVYGILIDDHTKISRRALGFDQGNETFNVEGGVSGEKGTIQFTRVLGSRPSFADDGYGGVNVTPNGSDGYTLKLTHFYSKYSQYGLSFLDLKNGETRRRVIGTFGMIGFTKKFYGLFQYDHGRDEPALTQFDVFFGRLGYVLFQGFHIRTDFQYNRTIQTDFRSYGLGAQWFPTPHWELQGYYDLTNQNGIPGSVWLFMVHYYI